MRHPESHIYDGLCFPHPPPIPPSPPGKGGYRFVVYIADEVPLPQIWGASCLNYSTNRISRFLIPGIEIETWCFSVIPRSSNLARRFFAFSRDFTFNIIV